MVAVSYDLYILILSLYTTLLFILSIYGYKSKGTLTKLFTLMSLTGFFFCGTVLITVFIENIKLITFLNSIHSFAYVLFISFWILFIGKYNNIDKLNYEKTRDILLIFPIIILDFVLLNLHYPLIIYYSTKDLIFIKGPVAYLTYIYFAFITVLGEIILLNELRNSDTKSRRSIFVLISVPLIPTLYFAAFPTPGMNFITLFYTISIFILFYTLYITNTFDFKPFLRETFLKNISVGMAFLMSMII